MSVLQTCAWMVEEATATAASPSMVVLVSLVGISCCLCHQWEAYRWAHVHPDSFQNVCFLVHSVICHSRKCVKIRMDACLVASEEAVIGSAPACASNIKHAGGLTEDVSKTLLLEFFQDFCSLRC